MTFKRITLTVLLTVMSAVYAISASYTIEGTVLLENQTQHDGVSIQLKRKAPAESEVINLNSDENGFFSCELEAGIFDVFYSKEGFASEALLEVMVYSNVKLAEIELSDMGLSGEINGVLKKGTYVVGADVIVPFGEKLEIEPGTKLLFKPDVKFDIRGEILAKGIESDSIFFRPEKEDEPWLGIELNYTEKPIQTDFAYVKVQGASDTGIKINRSAVVENSVFVNNSGDNGGAILLATNFYHKVFIMNTIFQHNQSRAGGAIFYSPYGQSMNKVSHAIVNCIFDGNIANKGACVSFESYESTVNSNACIVNCLMINNVSDSNCGVLNSDYASLPIIANNIIANNKGCAVKFGNVNAYFGFNNVYNNSSKNYMNAPKHIGIELTTNNNGVSCDPYNNISVDPLFDEESDSRYKLMDNSPCIDAGLNSQVIGMYDFLGNTRILIGRLGGDLLVDMGPFEKELPLSVGFNNSRVDDSMCSVYPNPAKNYINVEAIEGASISIVNSQGVSVLSEEVKNPITTLTVSNLPIGVYCVVITQESGEQKVEKFIKE